MREFNKQGGDITAFADLLDKMLVIEPEKRLTATECIAHPFFSSFRPYCEDMRKKYPPVTEIKREITIIDCIERRWAANVFFTVYNNRKKHKWYSHDILFQAFQLFDRYLDHAFNQPDVVFMDPVSETQGKLNSKFESELYAYTCIYIMYKYYNTLYKIYPWTSIFPKKIVSDKNLAVVEEYEKYMIRKVTKYIVFNSSFLDILTADPTSDDREITVKNFFVNYGRVKSFKGDINALYKDIKTFIDDQEV